MNRHAGESPAGAVLGCLTYHLDVQGLPEALSRIPNAWP